MQIRANVSISLVLLHLALSAAGPTEEILESMSTPHGAEGARTVLSDDDDYILLDDEDDWPEEKNLVLESETTPQENELLEDEKVLLENRRPQLKDTLVKSSRIATHRSRFPPGVAPMVPPYSYSRFYPSYNPTSYYYPQYQPSNYVPNGYYPSYPTNYPSNYFPSNPAYPPSYYPTNPAAYPISSPYDFYPMGGVNEYARKHTIN